MTRRRSQELGKSKSLAEINTLFEHVIATERLCGLADPQSGLDEALHEEPVLRASG
jgi:hypothetical protein